MDIDDVRDYLGAVERTVSSLERDGKPARAVTVARSYNTTVEDVWDAVTNGERIPRWFLPISGELKLGGRYQLEGNAGGTITACEPPSCPGLATFSQKKLPVPYGGCVRGQATFPCEPVAPTR